MDEEEIKMEYDKARAEFRASNPGESFMGYKQYKKSHYSNGDTMEEEGENYTTRDDGKAINIKVYSGSKRKKGEGTTYSSKYLEKEEAKELAKKYAKNYKSREAYEKKKAYWQNRQKYIRQAAAQKAKRDVMGGGMFGGLGSLFSGFANSSVAEFGQMARGANQQTSGGGFPRFDDNSMFGGINERVESQGRATLGRQQQIYESQGRRKWKKKKRQREITSYDLDNKFKGENLPSFLR